MTANLAITGRGKLAVKSLDKGESIMGNETPKKVIEMLKVLVEQTYSRTASEKKKQVTLKEETGFSLVRIFSYTGSVKKKDLLEKGHVEMNVFQTTPEGRKLFRESLKKVTFLDSVIESVNAETLRLAQNANRIWDKISEEAQIKKSSLELAQKLIAGKYGEEAQKSAKEEFPESEYPALY